MPLWGVDYFNLKVRKFQRLRNFELLRNCLREQNMSLFQEGDTTIDNYTTLYIIIVYYELLVAKREELSKASLMEVLSVSSSL